MSSSNLFVRRDIEDEELKVAVTNIQKYDKTFRDICDSPVGKYTINQILELVEESLNYLEIYAPLFKKWSEDYLEKNRGELWLYTGLKRGCYLAEYWKRPETNFPELTSTWPFLFSRSDKNYKGFVIDLRESQEEVVRQRERQGTSNPNYKPFHPDGCEGCSCWMLDDMEQWYEEERDEIKASNNIFFNGNLQKDFYNLILPELNELKEQWGHWSPVKPSPKTYNTKLDSFPGLTPIHIIRSWIKEDFYYSVFHMFDWSDIFKEVWEKIDSVDNFIYCQRQKLKTVLELL